MATGKEYNSSALKKKSNNIMWFFIVEQLFTHTNSYRNENEQTAAAPNSMDESYKDVKWEKSLLSMILST